MSRLMARPRVPHDDPEMPMPHTFRRLRLLAAMLSIVLVALLVTPAHAAGCSPPTFVTSAPDGMWSNGGYFVHNYMWNASGYRVDQTLRACSYRQWSVTATADNAAQDGAVKTYPSAHKDFHNWTTGWEPRLSTFTSIRSRFSARSPGVGIYNVAYDIWLTGVPGQHEVMIWTDNYRQVPAGTLVAQGLRFNDRTWKVFATPGNGTVTFLPDARLTQGTLDIKARLDWLVRRGMLPATATLGQICFGVEIVSTGGRPAAFYFDDFSVGVGRT